MSSNKVIEFETQDQESLSELTDDDISNSIYENTNGIIY